MSEKGDARRPLSLPHRLRSRPAGHMPHKAQLTKPPFPRPRTARTTSSHGIPARTGARSQESPSKTQRADLRDRGVRNPLRRRGAPGTSRLRRAGPTRMAATSHILNIPGESFRLREKKQVRAHRRRRGGTHPARGRRHQQPAVDHPLRGHPPDERHAIVALFQTDPRGTSACWRRGLKSAAEEAEAGHRLTFNAIHNSWQWLVGAVS